VQLQVGDHFEPLWDTKTPLLVLAPHVLPTEPAAEGEQVRPTPAALRSQIKPDDPLLQPLVEQLRAEQRQDPPRPPEVAWLEALAARLKRWDVSQARAATIEVKPGLTAEAPRPLPELLVATSYSETEAFILAVSLLERAGAPAALLQAGDRWLLGLLPAA